MAKIPHSTSKDIGMLCGKGKTLAINLRSATKWYGLKEILRKEYDSYLQAYNKHVGTCEKCQENLREQARARSEYGL